MTDKSRRTIKYMAIDDIVEADANPKRHADQTIQHSIQRFSFTEPLLLDERTGKLVAGHGRLHALKSLREKGNNPPEGIDADWNVPVITGWSSQNDDEANAYLVADNRLTELGGWDDKELFQLLDSLDDLEGVGYTLDDLDELAKKAYGDLPTGDAETDHTGDGVWGVIVEVGSEADQTDLISQLAAEGYKVKALMGGSK